MDDASAEAFFDWMVDMRVARGDIRPSNTSIRNYIGALKRIQKYQGINLDNEFLNDDMEDILKRYTHEAKDARKGRSNLSRFTIYLLTSRIANIIGASYIGVEIGIAVRDITRRKSRLNQYQQFCVARRLATAEDN